MSCPGDDSSMTSMEGEESRFSDAPSTGLHMDTDHEVSEESKEPVVSKDGANGWLSPGEGAKQTCILTNTDAFGTGSPLWKNQRSWLMMTPAPALMLPSQGWTACQCLHCLHVKSLEIPHQPLQGVQPLMHGGHPWSKCHCWCPLSPSWLLVWTQ